MHSIPGVILGHVSIDMSLYIRTANPQWYQPSISNKGLLIHQLIFSCYFSECMNLSYIIKGNYIYCVCEIIVKQRFISLPHKLLDKTLANLLEKNLMIPECMSEVINLIWRGVEYLFLPKSKRQRTNSDLQNTIQNNKD